MSQDHIPASSGSLLAKSDRAAVPVVSSGHGVTNSDSQLSAESVSGDLNLVELEDDGPNNQDDSGLNTNSPLEAKTEASSESLVINDGEVFEEAQP